jgi:beta-1,4-mannosyltransferase
MYESRARELSATGGTPLPKLLTIVTGKGPMKKKYMEEVGLLQRSWQWVRCISLWLEAEDYPTLLGMLLVLDWIALE